MSHTRVYVWMWMSVEEGGGRIWVRVEKSGGIRVSDSEAHVRQVAKFLVYWQIR